MRTLFTAAAVAAVAAATLAQEPKKADEPKKVPLVKVQPKEPAKKVEVTLKVGDPAPTLKATKWLQGGEVKEFAAGKVYVVEFWATWCGPCIVMMPHLSELQTEYKDKGVTLIGYSAKDPNNTAEKVAAFVEKRGPKLGYTMAYADDRESYNDWMRAAGRTGIPCCFVVGRDQKLAYIGHPRYLDFVLPKVVAGKADPQAIAADVEAATKAVSELGAAMRGPDAEAAVKALTDFDAKYPQLLHDPYLLSSRFALLVKAGKTGEAKSMAELVIAKATKQEDPTALRTVASALTGAAAKEHKELVAIGVKAAEAGVKVAGEKDALALIGAANAHAAAGNKAKAAGYGRKAVAAAEGESAALKRFVELQAKKFEDELKD